MSEHGAAPAELLALLQSSLERPRAHTRVALLHACFWPFSEFSDEGSAGGLAFPFEVFTDSLLELSHVKEFP